MHHIDLVPTAAEASRSDRFQLVRHWKIFQRRHEVRASRINNHQCAEKKAILPLHIPEPLSTTRAAISSSSAILIVYLVAVKKFLYFVASRV